MKVYFIVLVSLFFLSACSFSSLKIASDDHLYLQHNENSLLIDANVVSKESEWYDRIDIEKYILQNNKTFLFYENIDIDINWEFQHGTVNTIKYIFDAYESDFVYMSSGLLLLQLKLNDGQFVNMLVEKSSTQELSYVYGFSNEEFLILANNIITENDKKIQNLKYKGVVFEGNIKGFSTWSVQMLLLNPLLKQVGRVSF